MSLHVFPLLLAAFLSATLAEEHKKEPKPTDPFVISADHAKYGKRAAQQIPAIARVGSRFFCMWYGSNTAAPGEGGEGPGCYNILAYSDDNCRTWKELAYFVPNPAAGQQAVIDPRIAATPEGRLLLLIPVTAQKGRTRSIWATQLTNPLAKDSGFHFTTPQWIDFGFVGSFATLDGSLCFTANQQASKLHRITGYVGGQIQTEVLSELPPPPSDESPFWETSLAQTGRGEILACFRSRSGQFLTRSADGGHTWSSPQPFDAYEDGGDTKADLARSPSGLLVLAFNKVPGRGRYNMSLAASSDGGKTWPHVLTFDDRNKPGTSYPSIAFGAGPDGSYDGNIYIAYDHGRGRHAPDYTKEILVAVIPEASLRSNNPICQRFVVSP